MVWVRVKVRVRVRVRIRERVSVQIQQHDLLVHPVLVAQLHHGRGVRLGPRVGMVLGYGYGYWNGLRCLCWYRVKPGAGLDCLLWQADSGPLARVDSKSQSGYATHLGHIPAREFDRSP